MLPLPRSPPQPKVIATSPTLVPESSVALAEDEDIPVPYAVQSLRDVICQVISESLFLKVLPEDELVFLDKFTKLNEKAQFLSIRIFGRVQMIFRRNELEKIAGPELDNSLNELVTLGLLSPDLSFLDHECLIGSLTRSELEQLASKYNVKDYRKLRMPQLVDVLLKKASVSPLGLFVSKPVEPESHLKKQITRILGTCWSPNVSRMRLLASAIWLASLGSDTASGPVRVKSVEGYLKTELYNMLLARRGELVYPAYEIHRCTQIYRSSEDLQEYLELLDTELRIDYMLNNKDYVSAAADLARLKPHLLDLVTNPKYRRFDVPSFLRRYTTPYRALRILYTGVDLLERRRLYSEAVALILSILQLQIPETASSTCPLDELGPCRVSRLLIRLLIDQGNHLKQPLSALRLVQQFLYRDACDCSKAMVCYGLRSGLRLSLQEQINKLLESVQPFGQNSLGVLDESTQKPKRRRTNDKLPDVLSDQFSVAESPLLTACLVGTLMQAAEVHISAPVNASSKEIGTHRPHYLWTEVVQLKTPTNYPEQPTSNLPLNRSESHTLLLNVEQWTLRHYMHNLGYEQGVHTESRAYHLLFLLLFYDILFDHSFPDVFYSFRQSAPLDLFSDDFYLCRKEVIEQRLDWILNATHSVQQASDADQQDPIEERFRNCWTAHYGERCLWVDWELLDSPKAASDLFWCLGTQVLHAVCRQLATDFRNWRSGMPDLVLWSPSNCRAKIVEVKGPGDHLSSQQIMWLDVLVRAGADVEICHVSE